MNELIMTDVNARDKNVLFLVLGAMINAKSPRDWFRSVDSCGEGLLRPA